MAQRSFGSRKRNRQYEKIKRSARSSGKSLRTAKRIAAATTNKTRRRMRVRRSRATRKAR